MGSGRSDVNQRVGYRDLAEEWQIGEEVLVKKQRATGSQSTS